MNFQVQKQTKFCTDIKTMKFYRFSSIYEQNGNDSEIIGLLLRTAQTTTKTFGCY